MRRAFVVNAITVQVLKVAIRRDRPAPGVEKDGWFGHEDLSFPSGHTAAAFAIGTVLAESGDDKRRALRRTLGYGIGVYTAYQRVNHDSHWFSDTVAGAAIGIAAANVVMRRRREAEPFGHLGIAPMHDGMMLTYTVPLR
jgi:membrane-associated phospholipid phosphatase